jgi:hypothetical protein
MTSDDLLIASLIRSLAITTEDVMARAWRPASREGTGTDQARSRNVPGTDQERSAGRGRGGRGGGGRGGGRGGRGLGRGDAGMREDRPSRAPSGTRSGRDEGGGAAEGEGALDGIDLAGLGIDAPGAVTR